MSVKNDPSFDYLHADDSPSVIFRCISGSRAYGTSGPSSDVDIRGVFALPVESYLSLRTIPSQYSNPSNDITYYNLRRFLELASVANPNFLELLFMPEDCVLKITQPWQYIVQHRGLFVTKKAYESHVAYAMAQIKRARGQNKWINNPKSETPPKREDYCWVILRDSNETRFPYRPQSLQNAGISLDNCCVARVEHSASLYRLYPAFAETQGVFHNGKIVCSSIPMDKEDLCLGLLLYNGPGYEKDLRDHQHYWKWKSNRNESRWQHQELGILDYDAKNLMHTVRLILSARSLFVHGMPQVRFDGEELGLLIDIRSGRYSYDELLDITNDLLEEITQLRDKSALMEEPDQQAINRIHREVTALWEANNND